MVYEMRKHQRMGVRQIMCVDGRTAILNNISAGGLLVTCRWLPTSRNVLVNLSIHKQEFQLDGIVQWVKRQSSAKNYHDMGILIPNAPDLFVDFLSGMSSET